MHEHLEDIIKDIYTLEPELRDRDGEVRPLVEALISANPQVVPRDEFVTSLRARLVPRHSLVKDQKHHSINWWFVHLMPVGAIAILTLILAPSLRGPGMYSTTTDDLSPLATEVAPEPNGKRAAGPESVSLMQVTDLAQESSDSFTMSDQVPGDMVTIDSVTLSLPGFAVVHENVNGELGTIVGTSTLLNMGISGSVPVSLTRAIKEGETFYLALYHDDGDGSFTEGHDTPVLEPTLGTPLTMLFEVREFVRAVENGSIAP